MNKTTINQNPEQLARDRIDQHLVEAGWAVQDKKTIDFNAGRGIAVREYQTDVGPADYVLFVDKRAVGVIEAKPEEWGHKITTVEDQSAGYAAATLKWINNQAPLPFVYESTGVITRFTDDRDPKPRSREVFNFHRPETLAEWLRKPASLRVWQAYAHLDDYQGNSPISELTALVALIRRACGIDSTLTAYADTVQKNFKDWIFKHHSGAGEKFSEEQMDWLWMIRDRVISSFHIERDDLEMAPFDAQGGMGRMRS